MRHLSCTFRGQHFEFLYYPDPQSSKFELRAVQFRTNFSRPGGSVDQVCDTTSPAPASLRVHLPHRELPVRPTLPHPPIRDLHNTFAYRGVLIG